MNFYVFTAAIFHSYRYNDDKFIYVYYEEETPTKYKNE